MLNKLQRTSGRSSIRNLYDLFKDYGILAGNKVLPQKWKPSQLTVDRAITNLKFNPFTMKAAFSDAKLTNKMLQDLALDVSKHQGMKDLAAALGKNKAQFKMLPARGLGKLVRFGRKSAPVLAGLLASGLFNNWTGANKDYDAMVSQKLYGE